MPSLKLPAVCDVSVTNVCNAACDFCGFAREGAERQDAISRHECVRAGVANPAPPRYPICDIARRRTAGPPRDRWPGLADGLGRHIMCRHHQFPFIGASLRGGPTPRVIACEPSACPTLTRGKYAYDFGDTGHLTLLVKMHTLGSTFVPPGFHAGGLRYHGMAPLVSLIQDLGLIESRAYTQTTCFEAGVQFARIEGVLPAPEANHAVRGAIDEAQRCKEEGVSRTILFNLCGHGHFDMQAYIDYMAGRLEDRAYDDAQLAAALAGLPRVAAE